MSETQSTAPVVTAAPLPPATVIGTSAQPSHQVEGVSSTGGTAVPSEPPILPDHPVVNPEAVHPASPDPAFKPLVEPMLVETPAERKLRLATLDRHYLNRAALLEARNAKVAQWKAEDNATANRRIAEMQRFSVGLNDVDKVIGDMGGAPPDTSDDKAPAVPKPAA